MEFAYKYLIVHVFSNIIMPKGYSLLIQFYLESLMKKTQTPQIKRALSLSARKEKKCEEEPLIKDPVYVYDNNFICHMILIFLKLSIKR